MQGWVWYRNFTDAFIDVDFDASLPPGTPVSVTAAWYNPRGDCGPSAAPVTTHLAGGTITALAMRRAA